MKTTKLLLISFLFLAINSFSQKYAPVDFYLVDSLEIKYVSEKDKGLIDSLVHLYHSTKNDTDKIKCIVKLVEECYDDNVWPKYNLFLHELSKNKIQKSSENQAELFYKKIYAGSLNNLGYYYKNLGDIVLALGYYYKALKIQEEIKDDYGIAYTYNNIGVVYMNQGDQKMAVNFYKKCLKIQEDIKDVKGVANSLNNLGYIYKTNGDINRALEYYIRSLNTRRKINDLLGVANSLNNIGIIYKQEGNLEKALEYYEESKQIREKIGDKKGVSFIENNIGNIYYAKGDYNSALKFGMRSLELSKEMGYAENVKNAANLLSKVYEKKGDGIKALEMFRLFVLMKDSIINSESEKALIEQQTKYEFEKQKTIDDAEHEKQMLLSIEEEEKQKLISYSIAGGLSLVIIFSLFLYNRLQITRRQKLEIANQHLLLEESHKEITDSIEYAKWLQDAILPSKDDLNKELKDGFVFYQPKNVVSGDFYWLEKVENRIYFAVADCTGHGVPGALVSVVCSNALNRCVNEFSIVEPAEILNKTRALVIETFAKSNKNVKDGMDIALCLIEGKKLTFSGANNPLWLIRNKEHLLKGQFDENNVVQNEKKALIEFKPTKQSIGFSDRMDLFSQESFELQKGDNLYVFSDGLADQFGGEKGKKIMQKPFKMKLLELSENTMDQQKLLLSQYFNNWKGNLEQIDDVCVIGVKI